MKNLLKTTFLLTLLTVLFIWLGAAIGGRQGIITAFVFACIMNFVTYWFSDKIVLAIHGAKLVNEREAAKLYNIAKRVSLSADIPMPKLYIIHSSTPNAFATGRNPTHAAVAVTEGIMNLLGEDEIEGVLAHEIAHIKNRDTLIQTVVATVAGAISMLAYIVRSTAIFGSSSRDRRDSSNLIGIVAMTIIAPIVATIIQLAISRTREYQADASGAKICNKPLSLADALAKLQSTNSRLPMQTNPSTAHLFIINPLSGSGFLRLFSTHPPIQDRIAKLQAMAKGSV